MKIDTDLDLDHSIPPTRPSEPFREYDLAKDDSIGDLKVYRGSRPIDNIPGIPKTAKLKRKNPSLEETGTFHRKGKHYKELNAAELDMELRVSVDPTSGRTRSISYVIKKEAADSGKSLTARTFVQDRSTQAPQATTQSYLNSGYDRGHLVQREAAKLGSKEQDLHGLPLKECCKTSSDCDGG